MVSTAPTKRHLGLWSAMALVVANMIGAGVFTTSGFALGDLGNRAFVLLAWFVGGVLALLGALSYAGLARRMPESGGEYFFLSRTLHPLAGFLAGWVSLLAGFTAPIAVAALALQAYLAPTLDITSHKEWIGTIAIVLAFLMHGLRLGHGVLLQGLAVAIKLCLLAGFIFLGTWRLPELQEPVATRAFDLGTFAVTLVWISFSYSGWNATVYVASEVRDPRRNATRSLWMGCGLVMLVYLLLNYVFLYAVPMEALAGQKNVGAIAAKALGGDWLGHAVSSLVALALFTSISAMVMAGPRVYARMAQDGFFPRLFSGEGRIPLAAVALQACLAIVVVWWSGLEELLGYVGFTLGISTAATVFGLMVLRWRKGATAVPVIGYPVVPVIYVLATLGAAGFMVGRQPKQALWGLATVLVGLPLYFLFKRWQRRGTLRSQ